MIHWYRRCSHAIVQLLAVILTVNPTVVSTAPPAQSADLAALDATGLLPSPAMDGPRPTIIVNSGSGYAGQQVTVSGQGADGFPGVRVV